MSGNEGRKVLLIEPPAEVFYEIGPNNPSLGVLGLVTFLRKNGIGAEVLNADYLPDVHTYKVDFDVKKQNYEQNSLSDINPEHPRWRAIASYIEETNPLVVGLSCLDIKVNSAKTIAKMVKKVNKEIFVVVGGVTATVYPDVFLDCGEIDAIVQGEGELALLNLVNTINSSGDLTEVEGVQLIEAGKIVNPQEKKFLCDTIDINTLPYPDRDFLFFDPITYEVKEGHFLNAISTSRGCAFICRFCAGHKVWSRRVVYRDIDCVIEEIKQQRKKYGKAFDNFYIFDDNFLYKKSRVLDFCNKLTGLGESFRFRCYSRADALQDDEVIYALVKAGCYSMHLGLESGSNAVLKSMEKSLTVDKSLNAAKNLNYYELVWRAFIILGSPDETLQDMQMTIDFIDKLQAPITRCYIFHPYLGTDYFSYLNTLGVKVNIDTLLKGNQDVTVYSGNRMPVEEFNSLSADVIKTANRKNLEWENEHSLSESEKPEAVAIELKVKKYFDNISNRVMIIGKGRNIRWLAAVLHANGLDKASFYDAECPDGYSLKYANFLSYDDAVKSSGANNILFEEIASLPEGLISSLSLFADDVLKSGANFPKRLVFEILKNS